MIALEKFQETERLLATGNLSQRKIAALVGVSRATVGAIAAGKFRDRLAREQARAKFDEYRPLGPLLRCPGCGGMVHAPCVLCRVRQLKNHEQEVLRAGRRRAREQKLQRLLHAVRNANRRRDSAEEAQRAAGHLPAASDEGGPSDCK